MLDDTPISVEFHRLGLGRVLRPAWTRANWTNATTPGYQNVTVEMKVPLNKRDEIPKAGDWYVIRDPRRGVALGRVLSPNITINNMESGATTMSVSVRGVGWFDHLRSMAIFIRLTGKGHVKGTDERVLAGTLFSLSYFATKAYSLLASSITETAGTALEQYIALVSSMQLPETLGGGNLVDEVAVVHDEETSKSLAPGWVKESLGFPGFTMANIGGNFFDTTVGALIDSAFMYDSTWVELFPILQPPVYINGQGPQLTGLELAIGARPLVVYRTRPYRTRRLVDDVEGDASSIAPIFNTVTWDIKTSGANPRIPANLVRNLGDIRYVMSDHVNTASVIPTGFGASESSSSAQAWGLPLANEADILKYGLHRALTKWPFIGTDGGDFVKTLRAVAASTLQLYRNGHMYGHGSVTTPLVYVTNGNPRNRDATPTYDPETSTRQALQPGQLQTTAYNGQLLDVEPGKHLSIEMGDRNQRTLYAYCTSSQHVIQRNPNATWHGSSTHAITRAMWDDEIDTIGTAKVYLDKLPVAAPAASDTPWSTGGVKELQPVPLAGFKYKGTVYPLKNADGSSWGGTVSYAQSQFQDGSTGKYREGNLQLTVIHDSDSGTTATPKRMANYFQKSLMDGTDPRCVNFIIGADGSIWQTFDAAVATWHTPSLGGWVNNNAVGIELVHTVSNGKKPYSATNTKGWLFSTMTLAEIQAAWPGIPAPYGGATTNITVVDYRASEMPDYGPFKIGVPYYTRVEHQSGAVETLLHRNFLAPTEAQLTTLRALLRGLKSAAGLPLRSQVSASASVLRLKDQAKAVDLARGGGIFIHTQLAPGHADVVGLHPGKLVVSL